MKKIITTALIALFAITLTAQITGTNHYQWYEKYQTWNHKTEATFVVIGGFFNEGALFEFDLDKKTHKILNDSATGLTYFVFNSDSGYAVNTAFNGKSYYTYDNWKTVIENTTSVPKLTSVKKTSTGYVGYKSPDLYHSKDLINWTKTTTLYNYAFITEMQGRLTAFSDSKYFHISTDGGQTYTIRENNYGQTDYFSELVLMTDTATILAKNGKDWYFTKNSGKNWTKNTNISNHKLFYAARVDSLYGTTPSKLDSLYLSTDTGKTFQSIAKIPTDLNNKSVQKCGDYFVETRTMHYSKNITTGWIKLPTKIVGNRSISMKGNFGVIGGDKGNYSYTQNGGKTFENSIIVNANDLMACKVINDTLILFSDRQSNTYISKDGGVTWGKAFGNSINTFGKKFTHSDDLTKIVQLRAGQPLLSENYGLSWKSFVSIGGEFDAEVLPNGKLLFAVNNVDPTTQISSVVIEEISNTGVRTNVKTFSEKDLSAFGLKMLGNNVGYCFARSVLSGANEVHVFKTTDAWATYTFKGKVSNVFGSPGSQLEFHTPSLDTIFINVKNTSNLSASSDTIYFSYDAGTTWQKSIIVTNKVNAGDKLQAMHFYNGTEFISIWEDGRIFFNKDLGGSPVINPPNGVKSFSNLNKNLIYPNPATGIINLKQTDGVQQINIYSATGKIIKTLVNIDFNEGIDIQELPKGMYILQIVSNQGSSTTKIVKE